MKVLQLGKYYPPVRGGIENNVHFLTRGLAAKHNVTTLVFHTERGTVRERRDNAEIIRAGSYGKVFSTEMAPSYIPWIRRLPADLIHLHTPNPIGELGAWLYARRSAVVVTHHSDVIRQKILKTFYGPILGSVLRRADRIIVYTRAYAETSETLRPHLGKCAVIPHGLDLSEFEASAAVEARASELRKKYGGRMVLFVGRHVYYKGVDVLLRALKDLDAVAVIAGDGPMRTKWEALAREIGVASRAHFTGELPHAEKVALYRACAVFTLPCTHRSEAFGQVQVEAQACSRPVVTTSIDSGVPYVTRDGVSGLIVPPFEPAPLASALKRLLDDADLSRRMGASGRKRAEEEFSMETMLRKTFALYDEIAAERGFSPARPAAEAARA